MNHQIISQPNGTASTSNGQKNNKKRRKRKFFQTNGTAMNSITMQNNASTTTEKLDSPSTSSQPIKKRRKNKKKKTDEGSPEASKPYLVVKNTENYSSNWKTLKEIISQEDKTNNGEKSYRNKKYRKPKGKQQNTNRTESTDDRVDNQETTPPEEKLDIWFDNVDPILLGENKPNQNMKKPSSTSNKKSSGNPLVDEEASEGSTKVIAMDCEMVGVGMNGKDSILARVSLVNHHGKVLYDKFVKPTEEVVDYRTAISGVQDAQAAMRVYTMHRREWEKSRPNKYKKMYTAKKDNAAAKKKQATEAAKVDEGKANVMPELSPTSLIYSDAWSWEPPQEDGHNIAASASVISPWTAHQVCTYTAWYSTLYLQPIITALVSENERDFNFFLLPNQYSLGRVFKPVTAISGAPTLVLNDIVIHGAS
ncbi:RNA exonuclease 4 [Chionoecetes opilio]|uniref:RNA exonuclease 4 n=1 Tax=Chionoecetes opilio TaxID=41210 RepID=A0A8J4XUM6_CHIOP|nr:RNA exonuclease 4 [Chionoecetes opilio]